MPEIVIVVLLIFGLFAFYAIGIYFNRNTPLPEGCELPSLKCEHCSSSTCGYSEPNRVKDIKDEIKKSLLKSNSEEGVVND